MKRPFKKKQNELLQDILLNFMAAELGALMDNFQEIKDCTLHAQMLSR